MGNPHTVYGMSKLTSADRLFSQMAEAGITPAELARRLKVSAQVVNNWRARGAVAAHKMAAAAAIVGVRTEWLSDGLMPKFPEVAASEVGPFEQELLRLWKGLPPALQPTVLTLLAALVHGAPPGETRPPPMEREGATNIAKLIPRR